MDRCIIHDTGAAGLTANSADTTGITITRNEIHHTSGTGEGLYLGANNGLHAMNHVADRLQPRAPHGRPAGRRHRAQAGSWGNRILGNFVHDTRWPCIIVYGTDGRPVNVIERNVCWNSGDNVMQVQGEALVRNNLLVKGAIGFHTHDHQGQTCNLVFVHNTIINGGPATDLFSWHDRPGMVFANNAVYSRSGPALSFPNGSTGVVIAGNVVFGSVVGVAAGAGATAGATADATGGAGIGFVLGRGLSDFIAAAWTGGARDVQPAPGSALRGAADARFAATDDLTGEPRRPPLDAGCLDAP